MAAMGQVALTTANVFSTFYEDNRHVVWDYDAIERVKIEYEGAFCGCVPGRYEWNVCDDFASLYPSQVQTCNLSFENFLRKYSEPDSLGRRIPIPWTEAELEEFRKDKNYFVTVMGNVYKNDKDYAFKRMQRRTKKLRDKYKYTGQKIEAELLTEIENLIKGNGVVEIKMTFSPDIVELLEHHFENGDIYNMSIQELKAMQTEATELRQEYSLLELACKTLGNAAYGASASPFFYFFNASLAADITGECRNLTKTMWGKLEEFFHETIWERKDLWEKFNFALEESKHDWYRKQPVSIYSDTDSIAENSVLLIRYNGNVQRISIKQLYDKLQLIGIQSTTDTGHNLLEVENLEIANYVNNEVIFVPIKRLIKHKVSKTRFRIKTKSGKEIIVTGDHSCIVFRNGEKIAIKAKDINKDTDKILSVITTNETN